MSQRISRRQLLGGGIKAGISLALWKELNLGTVPAFAITPARATTVDGKRFRAAFARLDEFVAAHLRDMGAPGMTLALGTRVIVLGKASPDHGASITLDMAVPGQPQPHMLKQMSAQIEESASAGIRSSRKLRVMKSWSRGLGTCQPASGTSASCLGSSR